jgi:prepilin peptidase CpaA
MYAPMVGLLAWATVVDVRTRRIPNWLTGALLLGGLAQSFFTSHTLTPLQSLLGMLCGFALTIVLFALRAVGGGDVKLMTALGAWLGPQLVLAVFLLEKVLGLVIVVSQCAWRGRLRTLLHNSALLAVNLIHVRELGVEHVAHTGHSCNAMEKNLPFALPTLVATLLVLWVSTFGRPLWH